MPLHVHIVMASFVLLCWLHVVFFEQIHASPPRWIVKPSRVQLRVMKVLAAGFATFASLVYVVFAVGAKAG